MSRCRATTFYLAPGVYRQFSDNIVIAVVDDILVRCTHRRDIERAAKQAGGTVECLIASSRAFDTDLFDNPDELYRFVKDRPELFERWQLCNRTVDGRRPAGIEHLLYTVARRGTQRAGGTRETVGAALDVTPAAKKLVRWFESDPELDNTVQAAALRFVRDASHVLDDPALQSLVDRLASNPPPCTMPELVRTHLDFSFLERYDEHIRVRLLTDWWTQQLTYNTTEDLRLLTGTWVGIPKPERERRLTHMVARNPKLLAATLSKEYAVQTLADMPLPAAFAAETARLRGARPLLCLHPNNNDPTALHEFFTSGDAERSYALAPSQHLSEPVADAARALLTGPLRNQTRSPMLSYNMLVVASSLASTPNATNNDNELLVDAYRRWTKSARSRINMTFELDTCFAACTAQLTADQTIRFEQHRTSHARQIAGARSAANPNLSFDEELDTTLSNQGVEVVAFLESQRAAPPGLKQRLANTLNATRRAHRRHDSKLTHFRDWCETTVNTNTTFEQLAAEVERTRDHNVRAGAPGPWRNIPNVLAELPAERVTDDLFTKTVAHAAAELRNRRNLDPRGTELLNEATLVRNVTTGAATATELRDALNTKAATNRARIAANLLTGHTGRLPAPLRDVIAQFSHDEDIVRAGRLVGGDDVAWPVYEPQHVADVQHRAALANHPDAIWPDNPKRWSDLPEPDGVGWTLGSPADTIDGTTISWGDSDVEIHVLRNYTELVANAAPNCMDNCTASYAPSIKNGHTLLLALRSKGATLANVEISSLGRTTWEVGEVNGPHNRALDPDISEQVTANITRLLASIPSGT